MGYSRIKVWIAAEVLTASDLNSEHNGHISNENDLDDRLIVEIATRTALESEHDAFYVACWNSGNSQIANNKVAKASMKDDSVGLDEIEAAATDPAAETGGLRTLGTTGVKACAGNDSRLSDMRVPTNSSVVPAKFTAPVAGDNLVGRDDGEVYALSTTYVLLKQFTIVQAGTFRIKFDLRDDYGPDLVYARIYKNDVAVGIQRSRSEGTWANFSEDIGGWAMGDKCQLKCHIQTTGNKSHVRNFRLYVETPCIGVGA